MKTSPFINFARYGAIAGNCLFILWVTCNAINEGFSGTIYQKISSLVLIALLSVTCFLLVRQFTVEGVNI